MEGNISWSGTLSGSIDDSGGGGVTPEIYADATVDDQTGTPSVTVTRTGSDENPTFHFDFQNLKGEKGDTGAAGAASTVPGPQGPIGNTGPRGLQGIQGIQGEPGQTPNITADGTVDNNIGTPSVNISKTGTDLNPVFHFAFSNIKGAKGDTGDASTVPGPQGPEGPAGPGIASGGSVGQILYKNGAGDYLTDWEDLTGDIVSYDNTSTGMTADDVQEAVDELHDNLYQIIKFVSSESKSTTITANNKATIDHTISVPDGYTPLAVVGFQLSGTNCDYVSVYNTWLISAGARLQVHNHNSASVTISSLCRVLCIRSNYN